MWVDRNSSSLPTDSCPNEFNAFVSIIFVYQHCLVMRFNQAVLPSPKTCAHHRSPDSSSRRFSGRGLFQVIAIARPMSDHSVTRCTLLASLSSSSLVRSSCQVLNSSTVPMVSLHFTPVLTNMTNSVIFLFLSVSHIPHWLASTAVPSSCSGVWDPWLP